MRAARLGNRDGTSGRPGFTLVELLVVLVILGLLSAVVIMMLPKPGGSLNQEAERFAARAKQARDQAILDSRAATLQLAPGGYEIDRRGEAAHYDWAPGTEARIEGGTDNRVRFTSTGLADRARVTLAREGAEVAVEIGEDGNVQLAR